jgi:hypothetical protein
VTSVESNPDGSRGWIVANSLQSDADISPIQLLFAILPFIALISALVDSFFNI